jgi:hypothetical protein
MSDNTRDVCVKTLSVLLWLGFWALLFIGAR